MNNKRYKELTKQKAIIEKELKEMKINSIEADLYYISGYFVDTEKRFKIPKEILSYIDQRTCIELQCSKIKHTKILWNDDIDINNLCEACEYEKYFEEG